MTEKNRYKEIVALNSRLRRMTPSASISPTTNNGDEVVSDVESEDGLVLVHTPNPRYNEDSSTNSDADDTPTDDPPYPSLINQEETSLELLPEVSGHEEVIRSPETLDVPLSGETGSEVQVPLALRRLGVPTVSPIRPRFAAEKAARLIAQQLVRQRRNRQTDLD